MSQRFTYGYRIDLEDFDELKRTSTPLPYMRDVNVPEEIFPSWIRIENQGRQGSCQGHALSSVGEVAYWINSRGDVTQFSRKFAYIMSQRIDGIRGDKGSTINGGRQCAMQYGFAPEYTCPYSEDYDDRIPDAAIDAAKDFKIRSHTLCRNYDDIFQFLASGQGGVEIGIAWGDAMMEPRDGVIDRFSPGQGGHAVCFLGYSTDKERSSGRNYLWLCNSWGTEWGRDGWALVSPSAVDQMARHQDTVMVGLSDLSVPEVRDFDWLGGMR